MQNRPGDATPTAIVFRYVLSLEAAPENTGQDAPGGTPSVKAEVTKYLEELSVRTSSRHTREAYRRDITDLLAFCAAHRVQDVAHLTRETLVAWLADQRQRGMSEATVARRAASMRGLVEWLREHGHVPRHFTPPRVKAPGRRVPHSLTREQVRQILATCGQRKLVDLRDRAVLEFLWSTGARGGELCSLDLDRLELQTGNDGILRGKATVHGKGSKDRVVYLTPRAADAIRRYIDRARKPVDVPYHSRAVFLSMPGQRLEPRALWNIVRRRARDAGIDGPVSPHTLRHSFATELIRGGASTEHVRLLLGHASVNSTQIYLHLAGVDVAAAHSQHHPDASG